MTGGVNINLYRCVSLLTPAYAVCLCVCPCVCVFVCVCVYLCLISNQSTSKKPHVLDHSKLDALLYKSQLGPSGIKVIRFDICGCIILSDASNVAQSPNQPKKQNNKKYSRVGGWMRLGRRRLAKFKKKKTGGGGGQAI